MPNIAEFLASESTVDAAEERGGEVVHGGSFAAVLLVLGDAVDGGDVSDQCFSHVVNERHLHAVRDVDAGGEGGRCEHGDQGHAVHVVRNRFTAVNGQVSKSERVN